MSTRLPIRSTVDRWTQRSRRGGGYHEYAWSNQDLCCVRPSHSPTLLVDRSYGATKRTTLTQRNHQLMTAFGDQPHRLLPPLVLHNMDHGMLKALTELPNTYQYLNEPPKIPQFPADGDRECMICIEELDTKSKPGDSTKGRAEAKRAQVGALECGHLFHIGCIEKWVRSREKQRDVLLTCPPCRRAQDRLFFFGYDKDTKQPVRGNFLAVVRSGGKSVAMGMCYDRTCTLADDIEWELTSAKVVVREA